MGTGPGDSPGGPVPVCHLAPEFWRLVSGISYLPSHRPSSTPSVICVVCKP